ncbi:MAG: hypothetical protein EXR05_10870 [Acetobacteraceae bacterium]|nr:hypothetical protein [Acetobacteraceae bacterium]MSP30486.1 hypothetical protein [Acetobacteraceae bacterium]
MKPRPRRLLPIANNARYGDDDSQPLIVPRNDRALTPITPDRVRRLRKHLIEALRAPRPPQTPERNAALLPDFVAHVAQTACTLCQGWCCKGGGEHAYLDEGTLARLRRAMPGLQARAILRLYLDRVPENGAKGSCIFHGGQGCRLDPSQRSDVCNSYFCGGLGTYITRGDATRPVTIFAGEGPKLRVSPALRPGTRGPHAP